MIYPQTFWFSLLKLKSVNSKFQLPACYAMHIFQTKKYHVIIFWTIPPLLIFLLEKHSEG